MPSFAIGTAEHARVTVTVISYACPPSSGDFYDANWLDCEVHLRAGGFYGAFRADFLTSELAGLHRDLDRLHRDLRGECRFEPMEGQLILGFSCDALGHLLVDACAMDQAGIGNTLRFSLSIDQTDLACTLGELAKVIEVFPVRS